MVSGKSQNQVGLATESRTLGTRDIGKVDSLDMIVCQRSKETERQNQK